MWYGVSSIVVRSIGFLLAPLLTYSKHVSMEDYGKQSLLYSTIPVLSILFTYGFETAYFRFSSKEEHKSSIYSTAFLSILFSTIIFSLILWTCRGTLASILSYEDVPIIAQFTILIIALDTLGKIPLVKLRQEDRPLKFAFVNIFSVAVMFGLVWFFVKYCPAQIKQDPASWVGKFYDDTKNPIVYVTFANVIQGLITLVLLGKEISLVRLKFNTRLWKEMMVYALPLIIVGLGGIINETFDRIFLSIWLPGTPDEKFMQLGIYSACYKLSMLITLFVQAFKMGAEPFFFKQAEGQNPQKTYARVMKFFVIVVTTMFLAVSLFLPIWSRLIDERYRVGLDIVPILLLANIFIGVYYNLSIWYKISNRTIAGTYITLIGAAVTIGINYLFIPVLGYMASAWATFFCYGTMMVLSYRWGQKAYPVPYVTKKMIAYLVIVVLLFFIHKGVIYFVPNTLFSLSLGAILLGAYTWFILLVEKKEFQKLPYIGKYIK
jgi:O-antigen/teichoic acid export membrane protein